MAQIITNNNGGGGGKGAEYVAGQDIAISGGIQTKKENTSVSISDAVSLEGVIAYGLAQQNGVPTPTNPVDIECNNGVLKFDGNIYADGTQETISDGTNTATAEMLLGMSSYWDTQNLINGKISRTIGIKVLDGTENWTSASMPFGTIYSADILDTNMYSQLICTHFINAAPINDNIVYKSAGSSILQVRYDGIADIDAFKSWLASQYANNTPVIVLYVLETPTEETVGGQTLSLTDGAGTFTITNSQITPLGIGVSYRIPGNIIDFTNESGYITKDDLPDFSGYQTKDNLVTNLTNPDDIHYPSAKAVSDAITSSGGGDMLKSVYDPNNVNADAFDYDNFINTPTIPTDTSELTNGAGYITGINGSDVTTALGYTPYNSTNPSGYVTSSIINNTAYGSSWNGDTTHAPTKDAVYDKISSVDNSVGANTTAISTINGKIPSAATSSNQLADKNYVNDSINSVTAYYITKDAQGNQFATYAELAAATTFYSGGAVRTPTRNDYTIVLDDETHNDEVTRYIYNNGWEYQYTINESPLTQAQLDALNSGITSGKVTSYDSVVATIANYGNIVTHNTSEFATAAQGALADTALQSGDDVSELNNDAGYITDAYHDNTKQDTLVSGTNIKTINGTSILGSGDISVSSLEEYTQAEYDALPSSKESDGVWRLIYE